MAVTSGNGGGPSRAREAWEARWKGLQEQTYKRWRDEAEAQLESESRAQTAWGQRLSGLAGQQRQTQAAGREGQPWLPTIWKQPGPPPPELAPSPGRGPGYLPARRPLNAWSVFTMPWLKDVPPDQIGIESPEETATWREDVFNWGRLGAGARQTLRDVPLVLGRDPLEPGGGRRWPPWPSSPKGLIALSGKDYGSAAHEYAHAWFEGIPKGRQQEYTDTLERFAAESAELQTKRELRAGELVRSGLDIYNAWDIVEQELPFDYPWARAQAMMLAQRTEFDNTSYRPENWPAEYYPRFLEPLQADWSREYPPELAAYYRGFLEQWPNLPVIWKNE